MSLRCRLGFHKPVQAQYRVDGTMAHKQEIQQCSCGRWRERHTAIGQFPGYDWTNWSRWRLQKILAARFQQP